MVLINKKCKLVLVMIAYTIYKALQKKVSASIIILDCNEKNKSLSNINKAVN